MDLNYALIDTHAHLYLKEFEEDLEAVVNKAKGVGLTKVLLPNIEKETHPALLGLVSEFPDFFLPMIGLHPCSVRPGDYQSELNFVLNELNNQDRRYCAIGEIGMDLYWDKTSAGIQEEAFRQQCLWASELNLPIAIHSRNATNEVLDILDDLSLSNLRGVFHCFGDGQIQVNRIIGHGFYMGIGGVLTFKNSGLAEVMAGIDLRHIILETDSPYLAPAPYRGKRNESSYLHEVAVRLAEVKGTTIEEIAEITTFNAKELFGID